MNEKNLEEKFRDAHIENEELEELIKISNDLSVDETLHLFLDSKLLSDQDTTYYKLKNSLGGEFVLGAEPRSSKEVALTKDKLAHTLILGKTQYGKSTLLALITSQFLENDTPYWSFEPKQDQRHLIKKYPDLKVVRLDEVKINPFKPPVPTMPIRRWWQVVWEVLTQEQDLLSGSKAMGYELLEKLLEESNLSEDDKEGQLPPQHIPTLESFADIIERFLVSEEQRSGPRRRYLERLKTRTTSLLFSFKDTFSCRLGWPIEDLIKEPIVFEYESIDQSAARFLILILLYKLFYYYQSKGKRTKDDFHYLVFDEGEKVFSPYLEGKATGNPFLNELVNWAKEFGLGFILANQTPELTSSIKDNATTRIVFNIDGSYINEVSSRLGLDSEQEDQLRELEVGTAVAKTSGDFKKPFLLNIPYFEIEKDVTDKEAEKHTNQFRNNLDSQVTPLKKREEDSEKSEGGEEEEETLDIEYQMLLGNIAEFPFLNLTKRQDKLGWGSNKLNRVTEDLRNKGLIRKRRLNKGGRGGSIALLELTNQALRYLKEQDIKPKQSNGRGGIVHTYWVSQLTDYYKERGYDVRTEVELNNVIADIVVTDQSGEVVALEVEVTKPKDTLAKLDELLSAVDKVLIIADKRTILNELEEEVNLERRENLGLKKAQNMDL